MTYWCLVGNGWEWGIGIIYIYIHTYIYIVIRIQLASLRTHQPTSQVVALCSPTSCMSLQHHRLRKGPRQWAGRDFSILEAIGFATVVQRQGPCFGSGTWPFLSAVIRRAETTVCAERCQNRELRIEQLHVSNLLDISDQGIWDSFIYWIGSAVFLWRGARTNYIGSGAPAHYRSIQGIQPCQPPQMVTVPTPELALSYSHIGTSLWPIDWQHVGVSAEGGTGSHGMAKESHNRVDYTVNP